MKGDRVERRLAITYSVTATTTLGIACLAIAAVGGGLFASAAPRLPGAVKQVEMIDDFIVLHTSTTVATTAADAAPNSTEGTSTPLPARKPPVAALAAAPVPAPATASASPAPDAGTPSAQVPQPQTPAPAPAPKSAPDPTSAPAPAPAPSAAPAPASAPAPAPAPARAPAPAPAPAPSPTPAPTTPAPKATTTTVPKPTTTIATTSSTLPPGVPRNWPAGKPIPPMPPGCRQPQLEDNGVWNCQ